MKYFYSFLAAVLVMITVSVNAQNKIYSPGLNSPADLAVDKVPDLILNWEAVTGITLDITYELQLSTNAEFVDAVTFPRTSLTAMTMSDLLFGGTYFWRVRAYDGEDVSAWSEAWSFTVVWTVSMLKPNDASDIYASTDITWTKLTGVNGYMLQVDTSYAWSANESTVTTTINGVYDVSDNDVWAVGAGGLVLHNDGTGWSTVESGVTDDLNDVYFVDASNGYAVGDNGVVIYFDGNTWTVVDAGTTTNLLGVSFADANNGVAVGDAGAVVVYSGGSWNIATTGDSNDLYDVDMINPNNIWACGKGKIVVNYDGAGWNANVVGTKDHYAIAMINENYGWVVGKSGKILRWNGSDWTNVVSGTTKNLNSVSFAGDKGIAVGKSGTMLNFDGEWSLATSYVSTDLQGVNITSSTAYAVGNNGVIIQKTGNGFNSPFLTTYDIATDTGSYFINNLLFGQKYYYRLRAYHGADTSLWSGVKSFTTYASPSLTFPSNGASADLKIKFSWEEYIGSTNYLFEIADNDNFDNPRNFSPDYDTLWVNDLYFGQEYFWRVAAQHSEDISDWSDVWNFTTVNNISLDMPENIATEVPMCPLFTWIEVMGTSGYELWVDTDNTFSNPMMQVTNKPQYQCQSHLEKNTVYYWKVRGQAGVDNSEWSDTWSFTTEGSAGIDDMSANDISIFPNPGNGIFTLQINSLVKSNYTIDIVDLSGKLISTKDVYLNSGDNNVYFNVEGINSGTYSVVVSSESQHIVKRLVIK